MEHLKRCRLERRSSVRLPAVDHHGASVRRGGGFHSSYEGQQSSGVVGHAVLRPGGEMELTHLVLGGVSSLSMEAHYV